MATALPTSSVETDHSRAAATIRQLLFFNIRVTRAAPLPLLLLRFRISASESPSQRAAQLGTCSAEPIARCRSCGQTLYSPFQRAAQPGVRLQDPLPIQICHKVPHQLLCCDQFRSCRWLRLESLKAGVRAQQVEHILADILHCRQQEVS